MSLNADEWYWDLKREVAVRGPDRGPGDQTLGPYASKHEAENWKAKSEERNATWQEADDEWNGVRRDP